VTSRLGKTLADLISAAQKPPHFGIFHPDSSTGQARLQLARMRLAWYSARRGRAVMRANIDEALKAHVDRRAGAERDALPEPTWCDCCGVPYPCHTRRMLTRPPLEAER
jgi:hypothetical protein